MDFTVRRHAGSVSVSVGKERGESRSRDPELRSRLDVTATANRHDPAPMRKHILLGTLIPAVPVAEPSRPRRRPHSRRNACVLT